MRSSPRSVVGTSLLGTRKYATLVALASAGLLPACSAELDDEPGDPELVAQIAQPIAEESDDSDYPTQIISRRWYEEPDLTFRAQSASLLVNGKCSGAITGPRSVLTASHCVSGTDGTDSPITVTRYFPKNGTNYPEFGTKSYTCYTVFRLMGDTDLALLDCDKTIGEAHGYLDYDIDGTGFGKVDVASSIARTDSLTHTVWENALGEPAYEKTIFLSTSNLTRRESRNEWFTIGNHCSSVSVGDRGVADSVCDVKVSLARPGVSGSLHLGLSHRILGGPTSTTSGGHAYGVAMIDYLNEGMIYSPTGHETDCEGRRQLNNKYLTELGLDPTDYHGYVDKNLDGVLDVQFDLEKMRGQDLGWLGFESLRRNRLWTRRSSSEATFTISPHEDWDGYARLTSDGSRVVLANNNMNLVEGEYLVLQGLVRKASGAGSVTLGAALGASNVPSATTSTTSTTFRPFTLYFKAPAPGASGKTALSFYAKGDLELRSLTLKRTNRGYSTFGTRAPTEDERAEAGLLMRNTFGTHGERSTWTRKGGGHPLFRYEDTDPAMLVGRQSTPDDGREEVTDRSSVRPEVFGQYCFDTWIDASRPFDARAKGRLFIGTSSTTVADQEFTPTATPTRVCSPNFAIAGATPEVKISLEGGYGYFLVDNGEFRTPATYEDLVAHPYQEFTSPRVTVGSSSAPPLANYLHATAYCSRQGLSRAEAYATECVANGGKYAISQPGGGWTIQTSSSDCVNAISAIVCK